MYINIYIYIYIYLLIAPKVEDKMVIPTSNKKHLPNKKRPPRQQTSPATTNILRHRDDQTISPGMVFLWGWSPEHHP